MKPVHLVLIVTILAGPMYAQQPPDTVASDAYSNTAMGTAALMNVTPIDTRLGEEGFANTAGGSGALGSNTIGGANTAFGLSALGANTTGYGNTALGFETLISNNGSYNTATGYDALQNNTTGFNNTASGYNALFGSIVTGAAPTGSNNTGIGSSALSSYSTGSNNTASGTEALFLTSSGSDNTASGAAALYANTTGSDNIAIGSGASHSNTSGSYNVASGYDALYSNSTADYNIAIGAFALQNSTTGYSNSALGFAALQNNTTGFNNTALGLYSLNSNVTGNGNIAIGIESGFYTTGSNDIDISNLGSAGESGTIRIGTPGTHSTTYLAGVSTSQITGSAVFVTASGQFGVLASSERYKTDVRTMTNTVRLRELRPVTFHLKTDPKGDIQYGLIAEEVAKVYPELVIRDASGRIDGVRYEELAPILLNEMQHQQKTAVAQAERIAIQGAEISQLKQQLAVMQASVVKLESRDERVAQR